jgi:hypothetical protein
MKAVDAAGRQWSVDSGKGVQLNEWVKQDWTYHAKGNKLPFASHIILDISKFFSLFS